MSSTKYHYFPISSTIIHQVIVNRPSNRIHQTGAAAIKELEQKYDRPFTDVYEALNLLLTEKEYQPD
jgi:hypothetical protein